MAREISNSDDVIDSRDVIERIEELSDEDYGPLEDEEFHELEHLKALREEGEGFPDWEYGATLVNDSYWEDYAKEWFDEVYGHELNVAGHLAPYVTIDYDQFATDLQADYTDVDFDGVTFWVRA